MVVLYLAGSVIEKFKTIFFKVLAVFTAAVFAFSGFNISPVKAATVTGVSDQPSSLIISTASNHKIAFTLVDAWSDSETITIRFPTGFSMGAVAEDDVDLTDDGVDLTTASNCAGAEQASVAVAANTLTLTICAGDGGAMALGSVVNVEIGANASASGTGSNRITNPAAAASYFVEIAGTSGNDGTVVLPITSSTSGSVSGTVAGSSSSGGGGDDGGCCPIDDEPVDDVPDPDPVPDPTPDPDPIPDPTPTPDPDPEPTPDDEPTVEPEPVVPDDGGVVDEGEGFLVDVVVDEETVIPVDDGDTVVIIPETQPVITVSPEDPETVASVNIIIDGVSYPLTPNGDGTYSGTVDLPVDNTDAKVEVIRDSGRVEEGEVQFVYSDGLIYEKQEGEIVAVPGATVSVFDLSTGERVLVGGISNPSRTEDDGSISWYVDNGTYLVKVSKDGYITEEKTIKVNNGVLAPRIQLYPDSQLSAFINDQSLGLWVTMLIALALWPWLLWLFGWLFLLLAPKRKAYGTVYNAYTKVELSKAIVRVYEFKTGKLVASVVTDEKGRYSIDLKEEGSYRVEAIREGFSFPSVYVQVKEDGRYKNVYWGGELIVKSEKLVAVDLPMDPVGEPAPFKQRATAKRLLAQITWIVSPFGVVGAVTFAVAAPSLLAYGFVAAHIVLFFLAMRFALPKTVRKFGVIKDDRGNLLMGARVRVFEKRYNKFVAVATTDKKGRYSLMLGSNLYSVTVEAEGYRTATIDELDWQKVTEPTALTLEISLDRG